MKKLILSVLFLSSFAASAQADMEELYSYETHPAEWCLAQNVYYEARGSSYADQVAVADVVLNRVDDNRYPNTVCDVVQQGKKYVSGAMIPNKCQFSWYCDGKSDWPTKKDAWFKAQAIAYYMINEDKHRGITEGATHYHATFVKPGWSSTIQLVGRIGAHIYYRWD